MARIFATWPATPGAPSGQLQQQSGARCSRPCFVVRSFAASRKGLSHDLQGNFCKTGVVRHVPRMAGSSDREARLLPTPVVALHLYLGLLALRRVVAAGALRRHEYAEDCRPRVGEIFFGKAVPPWLAVGGSSGRCCSNPGLCAAAQLRGEERRGGGRGQSQCCCCGFKIT